ncbi:pickpocket protein 28-like [Bradysia coprophila]|uniref:pickpocket protein 28-like n=1 Tax=Bradysia coprophila TaxID=38358 RepID=UPI00187DCA7C|nr:pickpocket protein 28-like [Bradysia coprophila]
MKLNSIFNRFNLRSGENYAVEDPQNRKKPKRSFIENTVSEYMQKSTIHGVSYVVDDERHKFERVWWFIMLVFSIFGAIYLIYQAYKTMHENPIIESPALNPVPVWDAPFPAVTFCPQVSDEFTPFGLNETNWPEYAQGFVPENLTELSESPPFSSSIFLESLLLQQSHQDNHNILSKILPEINVTSSHWIAAPVKVPVTLGKTITDIGACVTFNMYNEKALIRDGVILSTLKDDKDDQEPLWSRDSGFKKGLPLENYTYPFRSFNYYDFFHMSFNVNHSDRISPFNSKLSVFFHAPDEFPVHHRRSTVVDIESDKINNIEITPHLVVSEGLEKYRPDVRQCYYTQERHLKFYKVYTQNHCEWECLTNYTLKQCGCVTYHMPHFGDTQICGADLKCYWESSRKLFIPVFNDEDDDIHALIDDCDCLPTCTQLSYAIQVTPLSNVDATAGETPIYVSYKNPFFKKDIRSELHSLSEFFSNCGGSLGLFLGVSIFSIIELLYFCTVRLYLHRKRSDREKSPEPANE